MSVRPAFLPESRTLVQLSDFHLFSPPPLRFEDCFSKRLYGRLAWQRRRHELDPEILAAMVEDINRQQPDLVAVTGDLTHLGHRAEYLQARKVLDDLGGPERVMVIPGNHDAYVPGAWENNFSLLGDYLAGDGKGLSDDFPTYPVLRTLGEVAVIGLNTAQPRPLWLATGRLGEKQLVLLAERLEDCGRRLQARVILIHHPPIPGVAGWRRRLSDAKDFYRVVAARGAELILYGHIHRELRTFLWADQRPVPCFSVPAAAARGRSLSRRSRYHIYRLSRNPDGSWRLDYTIRRWSVAGSVFRDEISGSYSCSAVGR